MTVFLAWKQTDHRTCGAAALMVALAEAGRGPLSVETEMEIWNFANQQSTALPGSYPGRLAVYAQSKGFSVEIHEDREKFSRLPGLKGHHALQEHDRTIKEAREEGIPYHSGETSLEKVASWAEKGKVLLLVSTAADLLGIHWVLLQSYDPATRQCVVMDPALGINFPGSLERFVEHYSKIHPYLGIAIQLKI